jgi:hypothetical protein
MDNRAYLRAQAAELIRLARSCFDLDTASKLRRIAQDMEQRTSDEGIFRRGICTIKKGIAEIWTAAKGWIYECPQLSSGVTKQSSPPVVELFGV